MTASVQSKCRATGENRPIFANETLPSKQVVAGSSPAGPTIFQALAGVALANPAIEPLPIHIRYSFTAEQMQSNDFAGVGVVNAHV